MQFCKTHWEALRAAIDERGLTDLVAKDGEEAGKRMKSELEDGPSPYSFDPLMGAHNAIFGNALQTVGLSLMAPDADGNERCPICFLNQTHERTCADPHCEYNYEDWIRFAADEQRERANDLRAGGSGNISPQTPG